MKKNDDFRYSRTHAVIKESFLKLIDTIGFEQITVTNITNNAMISRTTFYAHYMDKYDLLYQIESEIIDGFKSIAADLYLDDVLINELSDKNSSSLLIKFYEYIQENQLFFKSIMSQNGDLSFYFKLNEAIKSTYPLNIDRDRLKIPENYAIAFTIGMQASFINEWIRTGMKESPQEIVSILTPIIEDIPKKIYK